MTFRTLLGATIPALALTFAIGTAHAQSTTAAPAAPAVTTAQTTTAPATKAVKKKEKKTEAREHHVKLPGYKTEAEAKSACGADGVVWHATGSKAFHGPKSKYFGKTKHGAYVCEKAALADHLHEAKN
ncbi:MAG TPA: hypothetical protein VF286_02340 [Acidiphilium sp.]